MTLLYSKCGPSEPTAVARMGLFLVPLYELDLRPLETQRCLSRRYLSRRYYREKGEKK